MYSREAFGCSRFTHIGRHLAGLDALIYQSGRQLQNIALLGSGPVEPFAVSQLIARAFPAMTSAIWAVDEDSQVFSLLTSLRAGDSVTLLDIARVCRDDFDESSEPNSNFTNRITASMQEYARRGLMPPFAISEGRLRVVSAQMFTHIRPQMMEVNSYLKALPSHSLDLIYMGLLLTNMRKVQGANDNVGTALREARRCLATEALLGVGGSLSPEHGAHVDLHDISRIGLIPVYVSLEYIGVSGNHYYGDYGIAVSIEGKTPKRAMPFLKKAAVSSWQSLTSEYYDGIEELVSAFTDMHRSGRFIVAALPAGPERWQVWFINESEARQRIRPDKRLWFDLLDVPIPNLPRHGPHLIKLLPRHLPEE